MDRKPHTQQCWSASLHSCMLVRTADTSLGRLAEIQRHSMDTHAAVLRRSEHASSDGCASHPALQRCMLLTAIPVVREQKAQIWPRKPGPGSAQIRLQLQLATWLAGTAQCLIRSGRLPSS